ncbi:hypothetical protein [Campylobacter sputorum]|uniref:hypothetical protein n=1 Tax=Campylobacter sputorum TaxID=206 RepID=UPI000B782FAB|nr:hypothetical protein [Campylobacter sputorum]ASM36867.1 hypothetical protein CSF_0999 [Campylobacter sputorum bv. faecalis CCUG 20703]
MITHSAGNEDIFKTNKINYIQGAKTPYKLISVGSPKSATHLKDSTSKVGAEFIIQINNPNDPVANGFLNKDGNYDIKYGLFDDLEFHKFENYFPNIKLYIQNKGIIKNE